MNTYPINGYLRAVILTAVGDLSAPTVAELEAGTEIARIIPPDGLQLGASTVTAARPRWSSDLDAEAPIRYGVTYSITGYHRTVTDTDVLWNLAATFRATAYLFARFGAPSTDAWAAGDVVHAAGFRWGRRTPPQPSQPFVTFNVPIFPFTIDDAAAVAA